MLKYLLNIKLATFILFFLSACSSFSDSYRLSGELLEVDSKIGADPKMAKVIQPYKAEINSDMNEIIGFAERKMEKGKPESLLGNFVADLLLEEANEQKQSNKPIHFCVINNGGLRAPINKGNIKRRDIFELMPFENELVVITLGEKGIKKMFEHIARKNGVPIAGFVMKIKDGQYTDIKKPGGSAISFDKNYKVLTSDYLANGGSRMTFFADSLEKEVLGIKVRDAIIEHIEELTKEGINVKAQLDNRIKYAK